MFNSSNCQPTLKPWQLGLGLRLIIINLISCIGPRARFWKITAAVSEKVIQILQRLLTLCLTYDWHHLSHLSKSIKWEALIICKQFLMNKISLPSDNSAPKLGLCPLFAIFANFFDLCPDPPNLCRDPPSPPPPIFAQQSTFAWSLASPRISGICTASSGRKQMSQLKSLSLLPLWTQPMADNYRGRQSRTGGPVAEAHMDWWTIQVADGLTWNCWNWLVALQYDTFFSPTKIPRINFLPTFSQWRWQN